MLQASEAPAKLLLVAGEASGDAHGAALMAELRKLDPDVAFCGLGGDEMIASGLEAVGHCREIAIIGLSEALRVLPAAHRLLRRLTRMARDGRPDAAVLIDAPDFNLRLAKRLHRQGIPVVYYVSPQLWAWRSGRVRLIKRVVRRMMVLFPFEEEFYTQNGVDVVHVGHPLVDDVEAPVSAARADVASTNRCLALLPGSRGSEIERHLTIMLDAVALLRESSPDLQARLIVAPTAPSGLVNRLTREHGTEIELVTEHRQQRLAECSAALCASGTATLEVGLLGVPMVVMYRVAAFTYFLGRRLVEVPHIALVNLVLRDRVVPELLQHDATPVALAASLEPLLSGGVERDTMVERLGELREALGQGGASARAANAVYEVALEERRAARKRVEATGG